VYARLFLPSHEELVHTAGVGNRECHCNHSFNMKSRITFDHATICGQELESMRQAFAGVSLATDYGGPHANGITHMELLGFGDGSYVELIAPRVSGVTGGSHWGELMTGNAGTGAWAIGVEDIQTELARLRQQEIETKGPFPGSRQRPDGKVLKWETASVGPGEPGALLPFVIQDHTPREWRVQASESVKDSGLNGIAAVVLGVKNLESAVALFRRAYRWEAPEVESAPEFGAKIAFFRNTPVMLANSRDEGSWLAARLAKYGDRPAAFLLGARDLRAVANRFQLSRTEKWFGGEVSWLESEKLQGAKLGVISG